MKLVWRALGLIVLAGFLFMGFRFFQMVQWMKSPEGIRQMAAEDREDKAQDSAVAHQRMHDRHQADAQAQYASHACDDVGEIAMKMTNHIVDGGSDSDSAFTTQVPTLVRAEETCRDKRETGLAIGLLQYANALEMHRSGGEWETPLNESMQMLSKCVTDFYGTPKGATCQTAVDEAAKHKVVWQS